MGIQKFKIRDNNKKVALEIKSYFLAHMHNFDNVLANSNKVKIFVTRSKSQICQFYIKLARYIFDTNYRYANKSQGIEIFDNAKSNEHKLACQSFEFLFIIKFIYITLPEL